jgi:hypothetical protein
METMLEATDRLRAAGYCMDLDAASGATLRCGMCGELGDAGLSNVHAIVRFEGDSNPADEAILLALKMPCGHRGLFSTAFGPSAPPDAVDVLLALTSS